jgi:hypothetical protein
MQLPNLDDTPKQRLRFLVVAGLFMAIVFALGWVYVAFLQPPPVVRGQTLPFGCKATITEAFGPLDGDGHRTVAVQRGQRSSAPMKFYGEDWPLACRFFADAAAPDSLIIMQFNPMLAPQDPGFWLDARTLEEIRLQDLPMDVHLLDQAVIE